MFVLARKVGQKIIVDSKIILEVIELSGKTVRLGFEAPSEILIVRAEKSGENMRRKPLTNKGLQAAKNSK